MRTWNLSPTDLYEKKYKRYEKKHPLELHSMIVNLATYHQTLESLGTPQNINANYIHREPKGVKAILQRGSQLRATRLYVYPDIKTSNLYLITIGDKGTQKDDIKYCKDFVKKLEGK
ncbi:MAG: hypothetical protein ACUZ8H_01275 [Candidatus Anammoxibacter sp.]